MILYRPAAIVLVCARSILWRKTRPMRRAHSRHPHWAPPRRHGSPSTGRLVSHPERDFGPRSGLGLITGASDDDPSGIATYSQAGAQFGWPTGSDRLPLDAQAFYGTIIFATLIGVGINFIGLDPVKALFWTAVINGVLPCR